MGSSLLIPIILIAVVFFLMSRGNRQRQRQAAALQAGIGPGSRVMLTSGLHGTVVEVLDTQLLLEIAPGVVTTWSRQAVSRVVEPTADEPGATAAPPAGGDAAGTGTTPPLDGPTAPERPRTES